MFVRKSVISRAYDYTHNPFLTYKTPYEHIRSFKKPISFRYPLLTLNFNEFVEKVNHKDIDKVIITDKNKLNLIYKNGETNDAIVPDTSSISLYEKLIDKDVKIEYKQNDKSFYFSMAALVLEYSIMIMVGVMLLQVFISKSGNNQNPFSFGQSKAEPHEVKDIKIRFDDVAGLDEAKLDLQEVVDFLKKPEKYSTLGAKIPKGCLLVGPPGTGKTLLAKAIAGEAQVPFYSCSASEFIELFVGIGASRIRSLFSKAAKTAPCIIFIDEIDAIGKTRGNQGFGGNDEREQTINQLLTEMDGFKENSGIIIIAATNRVDILDKALLRPGRFDRQIMVEYPDVYGRQAILKVHTRNKPISNESIIESISKVTAGYSGADLANLANEAAILAARRNKQIIDLKEFEDALEKVILGNEKNSITSLEKKKLVAVHEAGHALVALKVNMFDEIRKVTIIPRGKTGGVTLFEPNSDRLESGLYSREYLTNQIKVALGGRIAEEIIFGYDNVTTGASSDIERVQELARMMITLYGLSDKIGPIAWKNVSKFDSPQYSEMILANIDNEVQNLVKNCYDLTRDIILSNKESLNKIADGLLKHETLSGDEIKQYL